MTSSQRLDGRVAIVTGSTGGIGVAIVERLTGEGARLVLGGRTATQPSGPGQVFLAGDIRDEAYVQQLVSAAISEFGRLDILVCSHGVDYHSDLIETPLDDARTVFDINVLGAVLATKHALPVMIAAGGGSIVNIGSRLGQVAIPGQAIYGASKAALAHLSRCTAIDYAKLGIRANCVAPGMTETRMMRSWIDSHTDPAMFEQELTDSVPLGRLATPQDVAAAVAFLASDDARYVTGIVLPVDGGYTAQ